MTTPDSLVAVREILQRHHLLADQLTEGQAPVALLATGTEPDRPIIKQGLQAAGFPAARTNSSEG